MTAEEFVNALPEKIPASQIENLETSFYFDISGDGGFEKSVVLAEGQVKVVVGKIENPSCEVKCDAEVFKKIINKELNPMMAMFTGKLKIKNSKELIKHAKVFGLA